MDQQSVLDQIVLEFPRTRTELHGMLRHNFHLTIHPDPESGNTAFIAFRPGLVRDGDKTPAIAARIIDRKIRFTLRGQHQFSWFCLSENMGVEIKGCRNSLSFQGSVKEMIQYLTTQGLQTKPLVVELDDIRIVRLGRFGDGSGDPERIVAIVFWKTIFFLKGGRGPFITLSANSERFQILTASTGLIQLPDTDRVRQDEIKTVHLTDDGQSVFFQTQWVRD